MLHLEIAMLKTLIKRNGRQESFNATKVNHWAVWAADGLVDRLDWSSIVTGAIRKAPEVMSTQDFQMSLIKECLDKMAYPELKMAGSLYAVWLRKNMYFKDGVDKIPTVKELHEVMIKDGLLRRMNYSDEDYSRIEQIINHDNDLKLTHPEVQTLYKKYSVQNRVTGKTYETPQFVFIRVSMAVCEVYEGERRFERIKSFYDSFVNQRLNAPSPNFTNLGTFIRTYASCCLIAAGDEKTSIDISDVIAYQMTCSSAGIGEIKMIRSVKDPVMNGLIEHSGKMPYYAATGKKVRSSKQNGRGGALTEYISCFDPEIIEVVRAQNPLTPVGKQNRDCHFAVMTNRLFHHKFANNEDVFLFNCYTAPDLYKSMFDADQSKFETLYEQYENDPEFKKTYLSARAIVYEAETQAREVSTVYHLDIGEVNRHTPFKEPIHSSNLCVEVTQPTKPYFDYKDLLEEGHHRGEVSICNLGGINVAISMTEKEYEEAAYNALDMIDRTLDLAKFPFKHIEYTARARRNAAVGVVGLAECLARKNLKYDTQEGLIEIDRIFERHYYHLVRAALKLGKERGNAEWINKTKWPEGWLPIDTYKKTVDELVPFELRYDWEALRKEVIANGGIRFSVLCALMPTETSSRVLGSPNGPYPIRRGYVKKPDMTTAIDWVPRDYDLLKDKYQLAYDIDPVDQMKAYAVMQKWVDQSISADQFDNRIVNPQIKESEIYKVFYTRVYYGVKARYYLNSLTSEVVKLLAIDVPESNSTFDSGSDYLINVKDVSEEEICPGGFCSL